MSAFVAPRSFERQSEVFSEVPLGQVESWGPYKVLLIGNATVGKSSLLGRFVEGKFCSDFYSATVGIDYKRKVVRVSEDAAVKLQLWDTAGQERFRSLAKNYYRGADAILLIFDVTDPKSFIDLPSWLEELAKFSADERRVLQILIGNKIDLSTDRLVSSECGEALGSKFNLDYVEVSAKSGKNIDFVFTLLAEALFLANQSNPKKESPKLFFPPKSLSNGEIRNSIQLGEPNRQHQRCCLG